MQLPYNVLCIFPLVAVVFSTRLQVQIPSTPALPNPAILPPSTSASLTTLSSSYSAPLRADSSFDFRNVSFGSYLLDVHCSTYRFAPLRVDVSADGVVEAWGTFRGNEWENKGEALLVRDVRGTKVFDVKAGGEKGYYVPRAGCESNFRLD